MRIAPLICDALLCGGASGVLAHGSETHAAPALPMMAEVTDLLAARDIAVSPVFIPIDPKLDTVTSMGPALRRFPMTLSA
ncbi:MAG: SCO family protein [Roseovarius sp.]|nr:SCO family protein [Roseovarius sp.]